MELIEYKKQLPTKPDQVKYGLTISETSEKETKLFVLAIMKKYLSSNVKGKSIMEPSQIELILDFIFEECKNLQIEELNIIFRNGVLGRYGTIFNDISIDTICGKEGWIESYYKHDRPKIQEPHYEEVVKYNGNEMTYEQFLEKNPDIKKDLRRKELKKVLSSSKAQIKHVIEYCELLGHNWEEKKVKLQSKYELFEHKELLNFEQWCIVFVKQNIK